MSKETNTTKPATKSVFEQMAAIKAETEAKLAKLTRLAMDEVSAKIMRLHEELNLINEEAKELGMPVWQLVEVKPQAPTAAKGRQQRRPVISVDDLLTLCKTPKTTAQIREYSVSKNLSPNVESLLKKLVEVDKKLTMKPGEKPAKGKTPMVFSVK